MTVPLSVRDAQGRPIGLGQEVGHDDQTALFLVTRRPESVAKIWLDPLEARQAAKILAMIKVRSGALEDVSAWPTASLHDATGQVIGFLMPQVNRDFKFLHDIYSSGNWQTRTSIAVSLAHAFAGVHSAGQVMGNVTDWHVWVAPVGTLRLISTDSYQVTDGEEIYTAPPSLPEFTPPELQAGGVAAQIRTQNHDLFGLAVMLFKLLFAGRHPYSGLPVGQPMPGPGEAIAADLFAYAEPPNPKMLRPSDAPSLGALPDAVQRLFVRAFSAAHDQRPSATEWHTALLDMGRDLVPCETNPKHLRIAGHPCPDCAPDAPVSAAGSVAVSGNGSVERLWEQVMAVSAPDRPAVIPPEIPDVSRLPPLPLGLPTPPRSLISPQTQENMLRWLLRIVVLGSLTALVMTIQKSSVLAAIVEVGIVLLFVTLGRRFSVDWDGLIDNFQNAEGRFVERLIPTQGKWQAYHSAAEKRRQEVRQHFKELRAQYKALEEQYVEQNAYAQYQRGLLDLDTRRRKLQQAQPSHALAAKLDDQYASEALAEYLKRQMVTPNVVPNFSARMALHLTTMGIRRASDVQGDKLKVVRAELAEALVAWRESLVQFFHFNPANIPAAEREAAQRRSEEQNATELRRFEQDVRKFVKTDWQQQEDQILQQMKDTKAQAKQYQKALKELDEVLK